MIERVPPEPSSPAVPCTSAVDDAPDQAESAKVLYRQILVASHPSDMYEFMVHAVVNSTAPVRVALYNDTRKVSKQYPSVAGKCTVNFRDVHWVAESDVVRIKVVAEDPQADLLHISHTAERAK